MESNDVNSPPPDDAALENWLRTSASLPPLPDDGFSRRVLAALPPPTRRPSTQRIWFCVGGALVGVAVAAAGAFRPASRLDLPAAQDLILATLTQLSVPGVGLALGITLLSLGFVFRDWLKLLPRL